MKVITDLIVPSPRINLNGTSREELIEQQKAVMQAADELYRALAKAQPHGRDYQTGEDSVEAYKAAVKGWNVLRLMVSEIHQFAEERAIEILNQP